MLPAEVAVYLDPEYEARVYQQHLQHATAFDARPTEVTDVEANGTSPGQSVSVAPLSPLYVYGFGRELARDHLYTNLVKLEVVEREGGFRANYTLGVRREGNGNAELEGVVVYTSRHGDYEVEPLGAEVFRTYAAYLKPWETSAHVAATAVASGPLGVDVLSGAEVTVRGRGNTAGSSAVGSVDAVVGREGTSGLERDALTPGVHPVSIVVTSEDGAASTTTTLRLHVLGEDPVRVSARLPGLDYDSFMAENATAAREAFSEAVCSSMHISCDQISNVAFTRGSVVMTFDAYPVVAVDRAVVATPQEEAAADAAAAAESFLGAVRLFNAAQVAVVAVPDLGLPPGAQVFGQPAVVSDVVGVTAIPEGVSAEQVTSTFLCAPGYHAAFDPLTNTVRCATAFVPAPFAALPPAAAFAPAVPAIGVAAAGGKKKKKALPIGVIIAIVAGCFFFFMIVVVLIAMAAEEAQKTHDKAMREHGAAGAAGSPRRAAPPRKQTSQRAKDYQRYGYDDQAVSPYVHQMHQTSGQSIAGVTSLTHGRPAGGDEDDEGPIFGMPPPPPPEDTLGAGYTETDEEAPFTPDAGAPRRNGADLHALRRSPSSRMYVISGAPSPAAAGGDPAGLRTPQSITRQATLRRLADQQQGYY